MDSYKKLVGNKIRDRRKELGFSTQAALSRVIDVDQSRISRWESGSELPDPQFRERLAKALGIDINALFGVDQVPRAKISASDIFEHVKFLEAQLSAIPQDLLAAWEKAGPLQREAALRALQGSNLAESERRAREAVARLQERVATTQQADQKSRRSKKQP